MYHILLWITETPKLLTQPSITQSAEGCTHGQTDKCFTSALGE